MQRRRWLPVLWLGALLGPAAAAFGSHGLHSARAAAGEERADSVAFEAPAGCPSADAFVAKVGERGGRAARVVKEPDARKARYRVRIARAGRGFRGTLTIVDEAGSNERAVEGGTCVEVADALALVTAMALEAPPAPDAPTSGSGATPLTSASASDSPAGPASSAVASASASAPTSASASAVSGDLDLPPPVKRPVAPEGTPVRWALGGGLALIGLDGAPPLGGDLYVEAAGTGARAFAPSLRIGASGLWARRDVPHGGELGLRWTSLAIDACAVRALAPALRVDACAAVQLGLLRASPSSAVVDANDALRGWLALGGAVRAQLEIGSGFYLEARGGLLAPVTRDRFSLADGAEVYRVAAITLIGGIGVGRHFP